MSRSSWGIVLIGFAAISFDGGRCAADPPEFVPHQLVIRLAADGDIQALAGMHGLEVMDSIPQLNAFLLQLPGAIPEEAMLQLLELDEHVHWVEFNFHQASPSGHTQSFFVLVQPHPFPQYPLEVMHVPEAHASSTGDGSLVAVLDTGIDATHPQLAGRILPLGFDFVDMDGNPDDEPSGADEDGDGYIDEMVGHGTFIAGIVALVAPAAHLLPVRVLNSDGLGRTFSVAAGIVYATDADADVINLSLGTFDSSRLLRDAAARAAGMGTVVVAAAGNDSGEDPWFPAAIDTVIAVAATDMFDVKAPFSNYGPHLDLCAPGVMILGILPGEEHGLASGTSFSAAYVSGIAALLTGFGPALEAERVKQILEGTADDLDQQNPEYAGGLGAGRVNALRAVLSAAERWGTTFSLP